MSWGRQSMWALAPLPWAPDHVFPPGGARPSLPLMPPAVLLRRSPGWSVIVSSIKVVDWGKGEKEQETEGQSGPNCLEEERNPLDNYLLTT